MMRMMREIKDCETEFLEDNCRTPNIDHPSPNLGSTSLTYPESI